jgi:hypothetical protein
MLKTDYLTKKLKDLDDTVAKAQAERDLLRRVLPQLPDLDYRFIHPGGYRAQVNVDIEVQTLADVKPIVEALPPLPLSVLRGWCVTIIPTETVTEKDEKEAKTNEPAFGVVIKANKYDSHTKLEVYWWTKLSEGTLAQVEVSVAQHHEHVRWTGNKSMRGGSVCINNESFTHYWRGAKQIKWGKASAEYYHAYSFWWTPDADLATVLKLSS